MLRHLWRQDFRARLRQFAQQPGRARLRHIAQQRADGADGAPGGMPKGTKPPSLSGSIPRVPGRGTRRHFWCMRVAKQHGRSAAVAASGWLVRPVETEPGPAPQVSGSMSNPLEYWVATIGARKARLWRCWRAPGARWLAKERLVLAGSLENGNGRPPDRSTTGKPKAETHVPPAPSEGFSRDAAAWLMRTAEAEGASDIDVIAPEAVLEGLRQHWGEAWHEHIHEHEGDLSELPCDKVDQHPVFAMVLALAARRPQ